MTKNKLICIITAIAVFAAGMLFQVVSGDTRVDRTHQHEKTSAIPEISIDVSGQEIPGAPLYSVSETGAITEARYIHEDSENVQGTLSYKDEDESAASDVLIHIRGNSSRYFQKKSYTFHLIDDNGLEKNLGFDGMGEADEWVLYGPYLDRTLIRNYMCLNIAGEVMDYAPAVRYVRLNIDGEYQGLYVLMETITREAGRLNLSKSRRNDYATPYIVKLDRQRPNVEELDNYSRYTLKTGSLVYDLCYPGKDTLTDAKKTYIESDMSRIEKILYSYDLNSSDIDYRDYIDIESFAQYFVINEFFGNLDAGFYSTYMYKDTRGKMHACVWDFNNACDNYAQEPADTSGFTILYAPWFERLIRDQRFVDEVIKQYRKLRKTTLSDEYLQAYITDTIDYLGPEIEDNYQVWGDVWTTEDKNAYVLANSYLQPIDRNYTSYDEAVTQLRTYITQRGQWLDENIDNLNQYCHESRIVNETLQ